MKKNIFLMIVACIGLISNLDAQQTMVVNSLVSFRSIVKSSELIIEMTPGNYNLEDLPEGFRVIDFSGSNNTIDLTGVYIQVPVGCIRESYFVVSGNNNTIIGGEIEDTYRSGLTEVTDFSAYNQDRANLAYGLKGAAVMRISGDDNLVDGIKLTVRGSFPYGYGSMYGIGSDNVFGLDKRCGILIKGIGNTLDHVEVQQRAFGHGIYMQGDADKTVIKNTRVEGRVRETGDLYQETNSYDLPYRSNYKLPLSENNDPLPTDEVHSLSEDGFRMYGIPGSITIENCTAQKMRGGFRLYLGGAASVNNSIATDCGNTNFNLPSGGSVTNSSGNFAYAPLSDFRLSKNNTHIEWTILPSPNAMGPHHLIDILGNGHTIVLHRTPGPIDTTDRAIVVTGDNSTITNETEYDIVLEATTSGNTIISCGGGSVTDFGTNNTITLDTSCSASTDDNSCPTTAALMEAECYDSMSGIQIGDCSEGGSNIGYIAEGEWVKFEAIDLTGIETIEARTASKYDGGLIEVRLNQVTGTLLATIPVTNRAGWQAWGTDAADISSFTEGVHDVYFVFKGTRSGSLFNVNWFGFTGEFLALNSNDLNASVQVYPNPVTDVVYISLDNANLNSSTAKITLYTINGQKVLELSQVNKGSNTLDLSNLKKGIYILSVSDNSKVLTKKIVKI